MELKELEKIIVQFRDERNWKQFHTLKDLLIGLNVETSELSELFVWKTQTQIKKISKKAIENEIADIYINLNYLVNHFNIDLEKAILDKIEINRKNYPIDKSFNNNVKYNKR